jgi:2'-5' RNA ligase
VIRAFLAVELSQKLRVELATVQQELKHKIEPEMKRDTRISWAKPTSIHLTIKFLGDMDEKVIDPMLVAVEQAIGRRFAMTVPLERLGVFPRPQCPRVLWVGPSEDWEGGAEGRRIAEMHGAIEEACEGLRFLRETKPFSSHLTLARIKAGERQVGVALAKDEVLNRPLSLGSLAVESIVLMKSELNPTGSIYTKLWDVRLRG